MSGLLLGAPLLLGLGLAVWGLRRRWLHELALRRLHAGQEQPAEEPDPWSEAPRPLLGSWAWVPWLGLGLVSGALRLGPGLSWALAGSIGAVAGVVAWLAQGWLRSRAANRVESQLADAIDLMTGALRAGTGLLEALDAAAREVRSPLRGLLMGVVDRVRLGDEPVAVFQDIAVRVPLPTFTLFSTTLAVHWETGGSLANTLSGVGETIRDRNELARRVRAQATQAQTSVVGILLIVWLLGVGGLVANPARYEGFYGTPVGELLVSSTIALQAVGLAWIARMSRIEA